MRVLNNDSNIHQIIEMCSNEARTHFGNGSLIVEKYLPRTRHIEIQVFGDQQGNVVHFGERECSLQRNYQKIIEEAPCVDSFKPLEHSFTSPMKRRRVCMHGQPSSHETVITKELARLNSSSTQLPASSILWK